MLMGYKVRECHFAGRDQYSAKNALDVLMLAYLFLKALEGPAARRTQYVRGILLQIVTWTNWHHGLPGACFSEEVNEAALGRLGRALGNNPQWSSVEDANDQYLLVQPGRSEGKLVAEHRIKL